MIVKTLSRKSHGSQLLKYVLRYVTEKEIKYSNKIKNDAKVILKHNLKSRSLRGYIKEFKQNESYRLVHRKDSVVLHHTILSFSNKDKEKVTDIMLKEVSQKYVELRSTNSLHLVTRHQDKDHIHLHCVTSGVQINGRSSRISKQQFYTLKLALDAFQKERYPNLAQSLPDHGKARRSHREKIVQSIKEQREITKSQLNMELESIYSKSLSKEQFISQIQAHGYNTYERSSKLQGIKMGETKYRFSGLGFDEMKFNQLDKRTEEMNQLESIRTSNTPNSRLADLENSNNDTKRDIQIEDKDNEPDNDKELDHNTDNFNEPEESSSLDFDNVENEVAES